MKKIIAIICAVVVLVLGGLFYYRYYFVFGEGVKAGTLNYCTYKGYIFKTYEGVVIQEGFKGSMQKGSLQSYEFKFSVENKELADSLMRLTGRSVELHYKEYIAPIPWRGVSEFVVDSLISVR